MRKPFSLLLSFMSVLSMIAFPCTVRAEDVPDLSSGPDFAILTPSGSWLPEKPNGRSAEDTAAELSRTDSRVYFVHVEKTPDTAASISYGGALNLKYFAGIAYDYLQENMPGKTVSFSVNIPRSAVSSSSTIPNRLRVTLKSAKDNVWSEYYPGKEWTNVRKEGKYDFNITIPEKPVPSPSGNGEFYPENTIMIAAEFYIPEGSKLASSLTYSISNFKIEGIPLDPRDLEWQLMAEGSAYKDKFLPSFPEGSTEIFSLGREIKLTYVPSADADTAERAFSGPLNDLFLTLPVYIPDELRRQKGIVELTIKDSSGTVRSSVKNFDSCSIEGRVHLTLPLGAFKEKNGLAGLKTGSRITVKIKSMKPHTKDMMPVVIEPLTIRKGQLIPFDSKWRVKDPQGLGGYKKLDVRRDGKLAGGGFTVTGLGRDNYQVTATTILKGGIDWKSPYYRVEFVRDLDKSPVDLDNTHLEIMISPITDTQDFWQKPFRARLGLIDVNGEFIFGPNISLSEGLSSVASVDVSVANPIPKGIETARFDPKRIKSVVINFEASQGLSDPREIKMQLIDLTVRPGGMDKPRDIQKIDYTRFQRDIASWELTKLVKEKGGYVVGMNYPFPVINISSQILAVPQIYPTVGMKVTDPRHFGFASDITRKTTISDLELLAGNGIDLVRLFTLGHLDGIFDWDEKGRDIKGFAKGMEKELREAAGMKADKLAEFLNGNEEKFFLKDDSGNVLGLEKHVYGDFVALLDILEQVEKDTGKRLLVIISLYDFLIGDGTNKEGPLRAYKVGEHPEVVTDLVIKVKAQALIWKLMKDLSKDERFYRYIACVEVMNEPDNATILSTRKNFNDLLNFVNEGIYLTKDAIGPKVPVSVGSRSWPADLRFWAPIADGLDILMIHYWESLESYNINTPGLWPLGLRAEDIWKYLGVASDGRPAGLAEIGPGGVFRKNLMTIERAGYDFCLVWSYSGHDSYDAKPFLANVKEYIEGQALFKALADLPREDLKNAFRYIIISRAFFEEQNIKTNLREDAYRVFLNGKMAEMTDLELKKTLEKILKISDLKGSNLGRRDLRYMLFKVLGKK